MRRAEKMAKKSATEFRSEKSDQELRTIWLASRSHEKDEYWNECGACFKNFPCDCQFDSWKKKMTWEQHDAIIKQPALDKTMIRFCKSCGSSIYGKKCPCTK